MRNIILMITICLFVAVLSGCASEIPDDINTHATDAPSTPDATEAPELTTPEALQSAETPEVSYPDSQASVTLTWGVPELFSISPEALRMFNAYLYQEGFDFKVEFIRLDAVDYTSAILSHERNLGLFDIMYAGFGDNQHVVGDWITNEYLEPLGEFLDSEPEIKQLYHDTQWEASLINGTNYLIPGWHSFHGAFYAFSTEYFNEEDLAGFSGWPWQVSELLNKDINGASVVMVNSYLSMATPFTSLSAVFLAHETGNAVNIYADGNYVSLVKTLNALYLEDRLVEYEYYDNVPNLDNCAVYIVDSKAAIPDGSYIIRESKPFIITRPTGLGIRSISEHKKETFELLRFLLTDSEAANILIYGIYGTDYELDDNGYPVTLDGRQVDAVLNEIALGSVRFPNLLPTGFLPLPGRPQNVGMDPVEFIELHTQPSPFIGFIPSSEGAEEMVGILNNLINQYSAFPIWRSGDIDSVISEINNELNDNGMDEWVAEVNRQLESFRKGD